MALPKFIAPMATSALTLWATFILKGMRGKAFQEFTEKAEAAGKTPGPDWFNPLTWGRVVSEIGEGIEVTGAFLKFQLLTVLVVLVAVGGSLITAYFLWVNYWGGQRVVAQAGQVATVITPAATVTASPRAVRDLAKEVLKHG